MYNTVCIVQIFTNDIYLLDFLSVDHSYSVLYLMRKEGKPIKIIKKIFGPRRGGEGGGKGKMEKNEISYLH